MQIFKIQKEAIEKYCQDNGYTLQAIYVDEGISGWTTKKRPAFLKMKRDAEAGKFSFIVIFNLSRFGRNTKEILINSDDFESLGVKLISLKENLDTSSPSGRAMRNMMATFAELDRDSIKERMQGGRLKKWSEGKTFVGKVPYGYRWNKESSSMEIHPEESWIYLHIVDLYLHEGLSDLNIALRLKEEGVKFRGRKYPATQTISYMLKNPVYYGSLIANRHVYDGDRRVYEKGKRGAKLKPADQHITLEVPPLISKTTWDQVQAKRAFNKAKAKRVTLAQDYWLRDLLVCGECESKIVAKTHSRPRKDGSRLRAYACYHHQTTNKRLEATGRKRCELPLINAEAIEDMVWGQIMQTLSFGGFRLKGEYQPSDLEALLDTGRFDEQLAHLEDIKNNLESELKVKERSKGRVIALLDGEDFNQEDFRHKLFSLNEEITTLKASLEDNEAKIKILQENRDSHAEFLDFIEHNREWLAGVVEELSNLCPADKKVFVESLVPGKITVAKGWEPGSPPWTVDFRIVFNQAVFERLASEGKLTLLPKNGGSRDGSPTGDVLRPPTGRWPRPGSRGRRRREPPPRAARIAPICR